MHFSIEEISEFRDELIECKFFRDWLFVSPTHDTGIVWDQCFIFNEKENKLPNLFSFSSFGQTVVVDIDPRLQLVHRMTFHLSEKYADCLACISYLASVILDYLWHPYKDSTILLFCILPHSPIYLFWDEVMYLETIGEYIHT